ncbi:hypothetical protein Athai_43200 [Actinocatenispora thailandica]|uniref:Translation initiation factor 2 n=1 Tax=Actinocatenispora thailandica TaxID=227318 RepID=A0A7R7HY16_9ACTN|nr:translation initiation factor 2 [Actinocatenispora thailandica]BCJ36817.1 hypothetical protein Athai_43200 [Actinocatenispora thailandica]
MTNADRADDAYWRRPPDGAAAPRRDPVAAAPEPGYEPPPPSTPPPAGWRPPVVVPTAPPRDMPAQQHARIDEEERAARTITYGVGLVAGAVVLVLIIMVCARLVG